MQLCDLFPGGLVPTSCASRLSQPTLNLRQFEIMSRVRFVQAFLSSSAAASEQVRHSKQLAGRSQGVRSRRHNTGEVGYKRSRQIFSCAAVGGQGRHGKDPAVRPPGVRPRRSAVICPRHRLRPVSICAHYGAWRRRRCRHRLCRQCANR